MLPSGAGFDAGVCDCDDDGFGRLTALFKLIGDDLDVGTKPPLFARADPGLELLAYIDKFPLRVRGVRPFQREASWMSRKKAG